MARKPTTLDPKNLHAKFQHVLMRRPTMIAARGEAKTVEEMQKEGGPTAPYSAQVFNNVINGHERVNRRWLTLLSTVFDLAPSIRAEDWYDLSDDDFFDKVDRHICHDPVDVLTVEADAAPDLGLQVASNSAHEHEASLQELVPAGSADERGIEVGRPRHRRRPITHVSPGDGLILQATLARPAHVIVVNVEDPDGADPRVFVLTEFLGLPPNPIAAGPLEIGLCDGSPLPIGDRFLGVSRVMVIASDRDLEPSWRPATDGYVPISGLRDVAIRLTRLPGEQRRVMAADFVTSRPKS